MDREKLRKVFADTLRDMYPDNPPGIHGLVVSILLQEVNLAELEREANRLKGRVEA